MSYRGEIQANTQITEKLGPFVDSTDGDTAETGLSIAQADIRVSKNGGNFAQVNHNQGGGNLSHDELGYYDLTLDTTDTNTEGRLLVVVHESGALLCELSFNVVAQATYTSKYTAKDTGYMDVNVKAVSEDTTAADNLELITEISNITSLSIEADGMVHADVKEVEGVDASDTLIGVDGDTFETLSDQIDGIDTKIDTAQSDLDIITDADGVIVGAAGATAIVDEFETQSQADPTSFHVNVKEVNGTAQTANDNGLDINTILSDLTDGGRLDLLIDAIKALLDDARAEPGQGAPPVNPDAMTKIDYLYKAWRNKKDNDGSTRNFYNDAGDTVDQKSTVGEAGGTVTVGEVESGP